MQPLTNIQTCLTLYLLGNFYGSTNFLVMYLISLMNPRGAFAPKNKIKEIENYNRSVKKLSKIQPRTYQQYEKKTFIKLS